MHIRSARLQHTDWTAALQGWKLRLVFRSAYVVSGTCLLMGSTYSGGQLRHAWCGPAAAAHC